MDIGKLIKHKLDEKKMTQKALAEAVGVTEQAVSSWIHGHNSVERENLDRICEILELDKNEVFNLGRPKKHLSLNAAPRDGSISELNTPDKANEEAEAILDSAKIPEHYSHTIYMLLLWLLRATIGLTYHDYLAKKGSEDETIYQDIFSYLASFFQKTFSTNDSGKDELSEEFYQMGGDLFESGAGCPHIEDEDLASYSMDSWYKFTAALGIDEDRRFRRREYFADDFTSLRQELNVALMELCDLYGY